MKHKLTQKVYFADTDAYGVVWHGTYLRWMEIGRVELCSQLGLGMTKLQEQDIAFPVTNINVRFKASAHLDDEVYVETWISKITPLSVTFSQTIKNKNTDKLYIQAEVDVVAVNNAGKLYRRMPEDVKNIFSNSLEN